MSKTNVNVIDFKELKKKLIMLDKKVLNCTIDILQYFHLKKGKMASKK